MVRVLIFVVSLGARALRAMCRRRADLVIENLALRQQVTALKKERPRPRLDDLDRAFWVALRRSWSGWASRLLIVNADTVAPRSPCLLSPAPPSARIKSLPRSARVGVLQFKLDVLWTMLDCMWMAYVENKPPYLIPNSQKKRTCSIWDDPARTPTPLEPRHLAHVRTTRAADPNADAHECSVCDLAGGDVESDFHVQGDLSDLGLCPGHFVGSFG